MLVPIVGSKSNCTLGEATCSMLLILTYWYLRFYHQRTKQIPFVTVCGSSTLQLARNL